MAQVTTLVDDMDGSTKGVRTVRFAFDGIPYELDLGPANLQKLVNALEPFRVKARQAGTMPTARAAKGTSSRAAKASERAYDPGQLREWQAAQGRKVTVKGRFPQQDIADYLAAK